MSRVLNKTLSTPPSQTPLPQLESTRLHTPSAFPPLYGPVSVINSSQQRPDPQAMLEMSLRQSSSTTTMYNNRQITGPSRQEGYRHLDPSGSSPRNLYIVDLPLDMTE